MSTLPSYWPSLGGKCAPEVEQAIRLLFNGQNDHSTAISLLNTKANEATAAAAAATKNASASGLSSSATGSAAVAAAASSAVSAALATTFGQVNNQTGTAYALQATDYASLVTFNNASSTTATLNSTAVSKGWFGAFENLGAGTVALTPSSGSVNGSANLPLTTGVGAWVFFDGVNWWAVTTPTANTYSLGGTLSSANVTAGTGAGTSPTVSIVGLDGNHYVQVLTGASPIANATIFTVTFTASRGHSTSPVIVPQDWSFYTVLSQVGAVGSFSSTGYSYKAGSTPLAATTSYLFLVSAP